MRERGGPVNQPTPHNSSISNAFQLEAEQNTELTRYDQLAGYRWTPISNHPGACQPG